MKKVLLSTVLLLTISIGVFAQKRLGDYIEIDGVPAFIFCIDEAGEHGLAMSIPAFGEKDTKKIDKMVKKGLLTTEQANIFKKNLIGQFNKQGAGGKTSEELFAGLIGKLTDNGLTNQKQILAYCDENGISLQERFPLQYWAENLGEGWFIPGDQELVYFANFYFGGLGRKHTLGAKYQFHAKDLCDNELIQKSLFVMVYYGLYSSTSYHADAGFRKLRCEQVAMSKFWLELFDTSVNSPLVCAIHTF